MKSKKIYLIFILIIVVFTLGVVKKEFQNDTFFYISIGKYISETSTIDGMDHWSFHDNLEYTYYGWVCDLIAYWINLIAGFKGLYIMVLILSSIIALILFKTLLKQGNNLLISFIGTLFGIYFSQDCFAARNQIFSFLCFGLELYFLDGLLEKNKKRYFWFLILLSIVTVNVHDTLYPIYFVIMLPYLAEMFLLKFKIFNKSNKVKIPQLYNGKLLIILFIICLFTGLITPLFGTAYTNMIKGMEGVSKDFIGELQQVNLLENIGLLLILGLTIGILSFTKTKIRLKDLFFIFGFLAFALVSGRSIFFVYLYGTVSLCNILTEFIKTYLGAEAYEKIDEKFLKNKILLIAILSFIFVVSVYNFIQIILMQEYINTEDYPVYATEWILNNVEDLEKARIWTHFNFGSYLEMNGIKVFIDARSIMYCKEFNDTDVMKDWLIATDGTESYRDIFDKYDITHALLYNNELINHYIFYDDDYKLIYQDDVFSLYEKNK